jgi:hypothetical protein
LTIIPSVSPQQQGKLAEFIRIGRQDFRFGPAIVFVYINRACFGKNPFFLEWSVLEQQPSFAGIEPSQAPATDTSSGLRLLQFRFVAELITHGLLQLC